MTDRWHQNQRNPEWDFPPCKHKKAARWLLAMIVGCVVLFAVARWMGE